MSFQLGDIVTFDHTNFNPVFWNNLSEQSKIKYYGPLGYGESKPKFGHLEKRAQ